MKFYTLIAIFATVNALSVSQTKSNKWSNACEYQKNEDGTECIEVKVPCNGDITSAPRKMSDCPERPAGAARTDDPKKELMMSN